MAWAAGNREYRQKITISGSVVAGDVTNFPVAISIPAGNDVYSEANTNGQDIFFTSSDEVTVLDFERSVWDKPGEEGIFYVKTDLSGTVDNEIYMYYGGGTGDYEDAANTWDGDFDAVWHFEDGTYSGAANEVQDSSGNGNHGRASGGVQGTDDTWGQALNVLDSNDFARFESNLDIFTEYTISCLFWIPLSNSTSWHTLTRGSSYHQIILASDHRLGNYLSGFHASGFDTDSLSAGMHHVAVVRKTNGTGDFYIDGSYVGNATSQPQDDIYAVGNYQGGGQHWGQIDEFRVSASTGRSATWLAVEAENLLNNSGFISFGPVELNLPEITSGPVDRPTIVEVGEFQPFGGYRQITTAYTGGTASTVYLDIPVDVALVDTVSGTSTLDVAVQIASSGTLNSAFSNIDTGFEISSSGFFIDGLIKYRNDFDIGFLVPGDYLASDVDVHFFQGFLDEEQKDDVDVDFFLGFITDVGEDFDVDFDIANTNLVSGNLTENYLIEVYSSTYSGTAVFDVVGDPWYDYDWPYRTKVTVDYLLVPGNLTNFPLTIQIDSTHAVFLNAQNSGNDVLFTNDAGAKLDHELSVFNKSEELLVAYIKADLSSSVDTDIYMYYGNPSSPDQSNATAVWTGYRGVYHFEDTDTNTLTDSTSNNRDGYAVAGITAEADGIVGKSWEFRGNSGDYVNIAQAQGLAVVGGGARTVSCYFYPLENESATPSWAGTIRLGGDAGGGTLFLLSVDNPEASPYCNSHYPPDNAIAFHGFGGSTNVCTGYTLSTLGINDWHSYSVTYGYSVSNRIQVYLDGQPYGFRDYTLNTANGDVILGGRSSSAVFKFRFGELRVYNGALSPDWMEAEHNNIIEMDSFLSFSEEELAYHWELEDYVNTDTTVSGGRLWPFPADVFSSVSGTQFNYVSDLYVSLCNTVPSGQVYKSPEVWPVGSGFYMESETTVSGGSLTGYDQDVYVSLEVMTTTSGGGIDSDIRLHAMEILNFFLDVDEYTTSAATMYVDIVDKRRIPISTANSYFTVSGTRVPVTFSGIEIPMSDLGTPIVASGYRMFYDPAPDFASDEPIEIIVHAENIVDDRLEETYYLLYGYNLVFDTPPSVEWPWGDDVVVWATATNKATCPTTSADGWIFSTVPRQHADLGATINPIGGEGLLPAVIYPQLRPKTFFYGANVKVVIRAKDLAGNEMEPFTLDFTIEDKPN